MIRKWTMDAPYHQHHHTHLENKCFSSCLKSKVLTSSSYREPATNVIHYISSFNLFSSNQACNKLACGKPVYVLPWYTNRFSVFWDGCWLHWIKNFITHVNAICICGLYFRLGQTWTWKFVVYQIMASITKINGCSIAMQWYRHIVLMLFFLT